MNEIAISRSQYDTPKCWGPYFALGNNINPNKLSCTTQPLASYCFDSDDHHDNPVSILKAWDLPQEIIR